jgi:hypothetical protein
MLPSGRDGPEILSRVREDVAEAAVLCPLCPVCHPPQQLRHLSHVDSDAPRLVAGQQVGSGSTTRFVLVIQISERLPAVIADDEARR